MYQMTWELFSSEYCSRQEQTPEGLRTVLSTQNLKYQPTGWMLLQCEMMDSSLLGQYTILAFGPNNTYKEIPKHPISPRGLASDMSVIKGFILSADLP